MSDIQIQAGGCRVVFTRHVADSLDDLDALDQQIEDCEAVIAQITARRDVLQDMARARRRMLREASDDLHSRIAGDREIVNALRKHCGSDVSIATLTRAVEIATRETERGGVPRSNRDAA